jgi:hypothetical protein
LGVGLQGRSVSDETVGRPLRSFLRLDDRSDDFQGDGTFGSNGSVGNCLVLIDGSKLMWMGRSGMHWKPLEDDVLS